MVITKGGKSVAAMVDTALFDKIRLLKREFNRLTDELAVSYQGIDESLAQQEIDASVKQARKH